MSWVKAPSSGLSLGVRSRGVLVGGIAAGCCRPWFWDAFFDLFGRRRRWFLWRLEGDLLPLWPEEWVLLVMFGGAFLSWFVRK